LKAHNSRTRGLYYKHVAIVNYAFSGVNKLKASLNDNARVVIYDQLMFIVQARADLRPDLESSLQAEENHYTVDQCCIGRSIHIFGVSQCCIS
jgi:hypothetical protein